MTISTSLVSAKAIRTFAAATIFFASIGASHSFAQIGKPSPQEIPAMKEITKFASGNSKSDRPSTSSATRPQVRPLYKTQKIGQPGLDTIREKQSGRSGPTNASRPFIKVRPTPIRPLYKTQQVGNEFETTREEADGRGPTNRPRPLLKVRPNGMDDLSVRDELAFDNPPGRRYGKDVVGDDTFEVAGEAELENIANCFSDEPIPYLLKSSALDFDLQSGSSLQITEPVLDESNPGLTVWSFDTVQGPNPYFGNERLHVIHGQEGLLFCEWKAKCRIEIDTINNGEVTMIWNGQFEVVGGTGLYRGAVGSWDFAMMTEPGQSDLSSTGHFQFAGNLDLNESFADLATTRPNGKD